MSFRRYVLRWLCLSLCYLAFTGSSSAAEVVAAALAGGFAAILSLGLRIKGARRGPLPAWDGVASIAPVTPPPAAAVPTGVHPFVPWVSLGLAVLIAAHDLGRARLPRTWRRRFERALLEPVFTAIERTHDGAVGDYVVWMLVGLALFSVSAAAALHAG